MAHLSLLGTLIAMTRDQVGALRRDHRDRGSVSVEQVLITAGLVALTVVAGAALLAAVKKYAAKI